MEEQTENSPNIGTQTTKPTPIHPRLKNFGNKMHTFTREDHAKGGRTMTPLKRKSLAYRALTTGKYSKSLNIPKCTQCPYGGKHICDWYKPGEACRMQVQQIHKVFKLHGGRVTEIYREMLSVLQKFKLEMIVNPSPKIYIEYYKMLAEFKKTKYGEKAIVQSLDLGNLLSNLKAEYVRQFGKEPIFDINSAIDTEAKIKDTKPSKEKQDVKEETN